MKPDYALDLVKLSSCFYFKFTKETENGRYEMDIDDSTFFPQFATSLGWRGDPSEYDEAGQFLIDNCPFGSREMNFIGVSYLWDELGGDQVEAQQQNGEEGEDENCCEDCGEPLVGDEYIYNDGGTEYKLCEKCFSWRPPQ